MLHHHHGHTGWHATLPPSGVEEEARFVTFAGEQLYLVHHRPATPPQARVLMCSAFGSERTFAYTTWVRLARDLARAGFEAVTFDYRGTGESTGLHEQLTVARCVDDVEDVAGLLRAEAPGRPLILLGLRMGALFAAEAFDHGVGDGLLLLDPPASAHAHLMDVLRRKLAEEFASQRPTFGKGGDAPSSTSSSPGKGRDVYIQELLETGSLEVEGLLWSRALFEESEDHALALPDDASPRPWEVVHLERRPAGRVLAPGHSVVAAVPRPPFWGSDPLVLPDLDALFRECRTFVERVVEEAEQAAAPRAATRVVNGGRHA